MSGEYISRGAAINKIMENIVHQDSHDTNLHNIGLRKAMSAIDSLPAADVVEVRHERWDLAKDPFGAGYVKCSRCGYKHCPEYYPDGSAIMHLFCPSCGAKMDGGQDNE